MNEFALSIVIVSGIDPILTVDLGYKCRLTVVVEKCHVAVETETLMCLLCRVGNS